MTEISTTSARTHAFYIVQFLSWIGMYLLWFEGDQATTMIVPYFGLLLANLFLSASFWLTEGNSSRNLAIRTIGSFFLYVVIEMCLCLLRPEYTATPVGSYAAQPDGLAQGTNRYRTAWVGAVFLLVSAFFSFGLAYTNFSAPVNAGSRIATLRGLLYLVAVATCIVSSAISWSYKPVCPLTPTYNVTNAVLVLIAVVILSSLFYGDGESDSVALLLACMGVITYGPVYSTGASVVSIDHSKWKAHEAVVFCGLYCFIIGVFLDRVLNQTMPLGARIALGLKERVHKLDVIALAMGVAGTIAVYAFGTSDTLNYRVSYGIIIPGFSILGAILGTDSGKVIATFFGFVALTLFDYGSTEAFTGYGRGGLLLNEGATLLVVLSNTIRGRSLDKIVTYPAYVAVAQFIVGCAYVPNDYSKYFLIALTVIAAENFDDADYTRVAYLLLVWNAFVGNFLLLVDSNVQTVINFASGLVFVYHYLKSGAKQAPSIKFGNDMNAPIETVTETVKEAA